MDLRPALAMLEQGNGIKTTARALGVSLTTLRRRLREAGHWPRATGKDAGCQKSSPQGDA